MGRGQVITVRIRTHDGLGQRQKAESHVLPFWNNGSKLPHTRPHQPGVAQGVEHTGGDGGIENLRGHPHTSSGEQFMSHGDFRSFIMTLWGEDCRGIRVNEPTRGLLQLGER